MNTEPQRGVCGRRGGGVGGKGPIWLRITLVPSVSSAALDGVKVFGSVLALLGGQGGISSRLCCGLSPALNAQSISAEAFSAWHGHLLVAPAVLELGDCSKGRVGNFWSPVKKVGKGRSRADTFLQSVTTSSNSWEEKYL